jgi:hypothetical protein
MRDIVSKHLGNDILIFTLHDSLIPFRISNSRLLKPKSAHFN